ncbi:MAG: phosphatidylglycerophosphatase A [Limimaricola sp.]|uniref:phosphatidylglycerophosphatase A family protein n=1 Tax=Limimaricola sp. TaxID=2211665 RepID=UPI001DED209A|nr:phosphatidylglycerophosphatase A [Limimaricola sp.]MBI1418117.1 phosphatidylglycerophosphatase A [Limimaricola sp.]
MTRLIATFGNVGLLRPAPGTWGSAAALVAAFLLYLLAGPWAVTVALPVAVVLGLWAIDAETRGGTDPDPSEIVIDEVAGQWIAILPVLFGAANNNVAVWKLWPGWVAAFLLFRLFDIWKPGWIGRADRRHDTLGVMLDDLIAGVFAAIGVGALAALFHLVLMR